MPTTIELTLMKIGIAAAVLIGACVATWFAADAHYSQALSNLEGQLKGAAEVQQKAVDKQRADDAAAAKDIDDQAKTQIGSMAATISDLSVRLQHAGGHTITVRPAPACPAVAAVQPDRPAVATGDRPVPEPAKPAPQPAVATIPADVLDGTLGVGIDALKAELLWRQWVRQTRQN
jgi:hypothetical protein